MSIVYQRKRALIIGINGYCRDPLKFCINDAEDLTGTLQSIGFDVSLGIDCNQKKFYQEIDTFVEGIESSDLTLFYFAGHGQQNEDQNYLLPSDYDYNYRRGEDKYLIEHAINVQYITKAIDDKHSRFTIYIFDCCRKYVRTRAIDMQQGLSSMNAPSETLIIFSCAPGKAVLDETFNGKNGVFTGILLKYIAKPHDDIEEMLRDVAHDVKKQTGGFQQPYRTSSITDKVCLVAKNRQERSTEIYSQKQLTCHGRACAKCGRCRDWYHKSGSGYYYDYSKRDDATCYGTEYIDHDGPCHYVRGNTFDIGILCQCSDNI